MLAVIFEMYHVELTKFLVVACCVATATCPSREDSCPWSIIQVEWSRDANLTLVCFITIHHLCYLWTCSVLVVIFFRQRSELLGLCIVYILWMHLYLKLNCRQMSNETFPNEDIYSFEKPKLCDCKVDIFGCEPLTIACLFIDLTCHWDIQWHFLELIEP